MDQIKDTNVVITPPVKIDPRLYFPEDVAGVQRRELEESYDEILVDVDLSPDSEDSMYGEIVIDDSMPEVEAPLLSPPQWMNVVSQEVKISADGTSVVDVVIEVEDILGSTNYEIRVAK